MKKCGRKAWKKHSGYHRRSLVETAMVRPRSVGDQLQAREWKRQQTEIQIGCALLNRFTQLGMPQSYKSKTEIGDINESRLTTYATKPLRS